MAVRRSRARQHQIDQRWTAVFCVGQKGAGSTALIFTDPRRMEKKWLTFAMMKYDKVIKISPEIKKKTDDIAQGSILYLDIQTTARSRRSF